MENKITLLYAALKSGFIKNNNILNAYFSIVAHIITNEKIEIIDAADISNKFNEYYGIQTTEPFIRQVLSIGFESRAIEDINGQYKTNFDEMKKYIPSELDFETNWNKLVLGFLKYSRANSHNISKEQIEKFILDYIHDDSKFMLRETDIEIPETPDTTEYNWCKYLEHLNETDSSLFEFVSLLNLTNIYKDAVFYSANGIPNSEHYKNLNVYLDTPLVFAILGMDSENRKNSYLKLIEDAQHEGCNFFVLDNNFEEAKGIFARASQIAFSNNYKLSKANKVAQFFHNTMSSGFEAEEFINNVENMLNKLNISIKETSYDINNNKFQEDETTLFNMVSKKYEETGSALTPEREQSIQTDVRSIIMVYRERKGKVSTTVGNSSDIFITINSAIANVSKLYESNRSINSGHIPAAISADLLGTLIWLHRPNEIINYKKKQILADCYSAFQPNKILLENYLKSLDDARVRDEITEDDYLFLRNHPLVSSTLMNVINGDYSRFSDRTYNDVYNQIVENSRKEYMDEKAKHEQTKSFLEIEHEAKISTEKELEEEKKILSGEREKLAAVREQSINTIFKLLKIPFVWIPSIVLTSIFELLLAKFTEINFQYFSILIVIISIGSLVPILTKSLKKKIYSISEKIVDKKTEKQIEVSNQSVKEALKEHIKTE